MKSKPCRLSILFALAYLCGPFAMISITNLSFHFGARAMYDEASLHIKPGDKIGLIGANGTGKSTLLRIITGEYQPDGGSISMAKDCTIGFLNQDLLSYQTQDSILHVVMQAFQRALDIHEEMEKVLHEMETNYREELVEKLGELQEEYERLDGFTLQARAEELLEGLGFPTAELQAPLSSFSGGWRMRVMLAKLLLQKPSLLLLDEPTNHLDLPSIKWIEEYLERYEGAYIVVSHDRYFLDNTVDITVEVANAKLNVYAGNYSFYLEEKALRNEIQKGAYENQQAKIRQTERFIERFKAKASKARQVQSRVKALSRLELVDDVVDENAKVNFRFTFDTPSGRNVVTIEHMSKAYGSKVIFKNTEARIERGQKIAFIGANGKGKSTLLRIVNGSEPFEGQRIVGHNVRDTFYAQHQLEALRLENNLLEELQQTGTARTEMELRGILGCFLFSSDDVFKKIKVLSGGEKSRVALAKTLLSNANFLLLDEPTNHLDMVSVNILIQALQQYQGTFLVISHDRFFVEQIANTIWFIEDQQLKEYPGTFEEYEYWLEERTKNAAPLPVSPDKKPKPAQESKPATTASATNNGQLKKEVDQVEQQINELEIKKEDLEKEMAMPSAYNQPELLKKLQSDYETVKKALDSATARWEQLLEKLGA
jgi:ATP-binding cassette subfamily F protein 3